MSDDSGRHEQHSTWNASAAHRWAPATGCPASAILATIAPKRPSSEASREGTQAHELLERKLVAGCALSASEEQEYPERARRGVQKVLDFLYTIGEAKMEMFPERRWTWPVVWWLPENHLAYGFSDIVLLDHASGTAHVIDYKHGKFPVEAEGSRQLMHYAHGVIAELGWTGRVFGHIVQPYRWDGAGPVSSWEMPSEALAFFEDEARRAIEKCAGFYLTGSFPELPYNPSLKNCHWCPGFEICPVAHGKAKNVRTDESPVEKTPAQLAELLRLADFLEVYIKDVRECAYRRARGGEKLPGFKLVNKRGRRAWEAGEQEVLAALPQEASLDETMPRELLSPAAADKLVRKYLKARGSTPKEITKALEALALLQNRPGSQELDLVAEDDPRPAADVRNIAFRELVKLPQIAAPLGEQNP